MWPLCVLLLLDDEQRSPRSSSAFFFHRLQNHQYQYPQQHHLGVCLLTVCFNSSPEVSSLLHFFLGISFSSSSSAAPPLAVLQMATESEAPSVDCYLTRHLFAW